MSTNIDPGELFEQFLREQAEAHAEGLGTALPDGLVLPHEDSPLRPLDARAAWTDAQAALLLVSGTTAPVRPPVPPDWSGLLQTLEPTADVPLGLGNFPQRVRSLQLLLRRQSSPQSATAAPPPLQEWADAQREPLGRLLAAGVLRLLGDWTGAQALLARRVPNALRALHENEQACLLWQQGSRREALTLWESQAESPAAAFNRGLAHLFLGQRDVARRALEAACAALPESGSWHHLASIYRTLAELE